MAGEAGNVRGTLSNLKETVRVCVCVCVCVRERERLCVCVCVLSSLTHLDQCLSPAHVTASDPERGKRRSDAWCLALPSTANSSLATIVALTGASLIRDLIPAPIDLRALRETIPTRRSQRQDAQSICAPRAAFGGCLARVARSWGELRCRGGRLAGLHLPSLLCVRSLPLRRGAGHTL